MGDRYEFIIYVHTYPYENSDNIKRLKTTEHNIQDTSFHTVTSGFADFP